MIPEYRPGRRAMHNVSHRSHRLAKNINLAVQKPGVKDPPTDWQAAALFTFWYSWSGTE